MFIPDSYLLSVVLCFITMLCWGSWANTQKLASKEWEFTLFYWDYSIGVVLLALVFGLTFGSIGTAGSPFIENLRQTGNEAIGMAILGGVVFNLANLLIVAAIDIAGMAVAFPVGIGIALVLGVILNYLAIPVGDPVYLFAGVSFVVLAIVLDALAYKKLLSTAKATPVKGIVLSIVGGVLMGFFYRFVAASIATDFANPEAGLMTPYAAVFVFSLGILASNFVWNTYFMKRPVNGRVTSYRDYFVKGTTKLHLIGILGGGIWCLGMILSVLAADKAGFAISYGLGQGATMVAAAWGVLIWKEFSTAPKGTNRLVYGMFLFFIVGLGLIIISRFA